MFTRSKELEDPRLKVAIDSPSFLDSVTTISLSFNVAKREVKVKVFDTA